MRVTLIPLVGPFHLRCPLYNGVTVKNLLQASQPEVVVTTALRTDDFKHPSWQDTQEVALPLAVIPWLRRQGLAFHGILEPSPDADAQQDFRRYALEYPQLAERLAQVEARLQPLKEKLEQSLNVEQIQQELLPLLKDYQMFREETFEDGPGTDWLRQRVSTMARRILDLPAERITVLASAEHCPFLQEALAEHLTALPEVIPTEESRRRSLLDFAFRVDVPEVGQVLAQLRQLDLAEARYHEANLLLVHGHILEALDVLETTSRGDFSEPYYLPGYLLARLGQLYDLTGAREAALRCYRGVKALSYAPHEALTESERGLAKPFELNGVLLDKKKSDD